MSELELGTDGMSSEAADKLAALTAGAAGAPTGMIHLASGDWLRVVGSFGLPGGFETARRAPARSTLAGWVISHRHPLIVTDLLADGRVPLEAPARAVGVRSYAGFPIRAPDGEIVGVCAVLDYRPRSWEAAELTHVDEGAQACTAFVAEQLARDAERQARELADRQRRFLDALLASMRTGVAACDSSGRVVFTNDAIRALCDDAGIDGSLRRALTGELLRDHEVAVARPGRGPRVLLVDAQPIIGGSGQRIGAVTAMRDVTGQRRMERFRQAELRVAEALNHAKTVAEAGPQALQALAVAMGWPLAELWLVDPDADVLVPAAQYVADDSAGFVEMPAQLRRGVGLAGTAWAGAAPTWIDDPGTAGSLISAATIHGRPPSTGLAVPIPSGDRILAVLTFFADVREDQGDGLVALLSGIAAQIGQFLERRRAEELALALARSKDEYLALVGHELRTPLTVISTYIELLREFDTAALDSDGRRMLEVMARNGATLLLIVDELLDLAALDSGHAVVAAEPVDLVATVQAALETVGPIAKAAGVLFRTELTPTRVRGDQARLRQVVTHLLDNAVRHSLPDAYVTATVTRPNPATVELTVADTGLGIPVEERHHLFRRFYRSSRTRHAGIPGAGLGLAISRAIVERHHGSIRLVPQHAPGTRIVVRLPAEPE